jgi:cytochrome P450
MRSWIPSFPRWRCDQRAAVVPTSLPRTTLRAARLGGVDLPPGTNVMIPFVAMHHDATVFPHPGRFDPARWPMLREIGTPLTYRFMPFGAGPRRCLGAVFADLQVRCTLAALLQRFSFIPLPRRVDYRISTVTMSPRGVLPMRVAAKGRWRRCAPPTGTITRLLQADGRGPD